MIKIAICGFALKPDFKLEPWRKFLKSEFTMPIQLATLQLATSQLVTFQLATLTTRHSDNSPPYNSPL
jgi:hypothetical protein